MENALHSAGARAVLSVGKARWEGGTGQGWQVCQPWEGGGDGMRSKETNGELGTSPGARA